MYPLNDEGKSVITDQQMQGRFFPPKSTKPSTESVFVLYCRPGHKAISSNMSTQYLSIDFNFDTLSLRCEKMD
jgi:hypothetical protein